MLALRRIGLDEYGRGSRGTPGSSRVRSGLMICQLLPPSRGLEQNVRSEIRACADRPARRSAAAVRLKRYLPVRRTTGETSRVCPVLRSNTRDLAAVNQIGMRADRARHSRILRRRPGPVAKSDFAEVAAAGGADAAAFLLSAIDPVRKLVVGDDVIELRRGLVVPGTPGLSAIHADGRALIDGEGDDVRDFRD